MGPLREDPPPPDYAQCTCWRGCEKGPNHWHVIRAAFISGAGGSSCKEQQLASLCRGNGDTAFNMNCKAQLIVEVFVVCGFAFLFLVSVCAETDPRKACRCAAWLGSHFSALLLHRWVGNLNATGRSQTSPATLWKKAIGRGQALVIVVVWGSRNNYQLCIASSDQNKTTSQLSCVTS